MGLLNIVFAINGSARPLAKQGGVGQQSGFGYTVSGLCFDSQRFESKQGDNIQHQGNIFLCSSQANALF
jgi:hypothetical protein